MTVETASVTRVIVISALRGERTVHSALENYTKGFLRGFHADGLNAEAIDIGAAVLISENTSKDVPLTLSIAKRLGQFGIVLEHLRAIQLALKYLPVRRKTALFSTNVSRKYLAITFLFSLLGYTIVHWIVDYYPEKTASVNRTLRRYSDLSIAINHWIARSIPQNARIEVFQGATDLAPPDFLNICEPDRTFRLLYAGKLNSLNCVDTIIELVSQNPQTLSLSLFGDGELEHLAREKAIKFENIEFFGLMPREEIIAEMRNAHGVLCVRQTDDDYYKGFFPSKTIEMIASPAHAFVSDMGEVTQLLEGAVVFVRGSGAEQLLDSIRLARKMDHEEVGTMVRHRSELLSNEYSWTRLTEILKGARKRT